MVIKTSIREQVYDILREKILNQVYKPGDKIIIDNLAKELQVSNSPIREAINSLEKDGLIYYEPNQGPRIINMTIDEINDLAETIKILLIGGYRVSCDKGKIPIMIGKLETVLAKQKELIDKKEYFQVAKSAVEFDMAIVEFSENKRLISVLSRLNDVLLLATISLITQFHESYTASYEEHKNILDAIKSNSYNLVEQAISQHYRIRNKIF
ncbi:MAG: GntR family transcriptional regulator [Clostridiaceae bacterium]